jgi:Late competence development protein ComFB
MKSQFCSVHNFNETAIFLEVSRTAPRYPTVFCHPELLADVACLALNRMPPRYICHDVDNVFFMTDNDCSKHHSEVAAAVEFAFAFVQSRTARLTA